jgi:Holliday junction resolvase
MCSNGIQSFIRRIDLNSKNKGKVGEREIAQILTHQGGWQARRTGFMQSQQNHGAADVECKALPIHWEVKRTEKVSLHDWIAQAKGGAKEEEIPVIAWRKNNAPWYAILPLDDLIEILQCADLEALKIRKTTKQNNK